MELEPEDDYEDEKYDDNEEMGIPGENEDEDDQEDHNEIVGARPRRISHLALQKTQKSIPKASSLFILSHTNLFRVFCNVSFFKLIFN